MATLHYEFSNFVILEANISHEISSVDPELQLARPSRWRRRLLCLIPLLLLSAVFMAGLVLYFDGEVWETSYLMSQSRLNSLLISDSISASFSWWAKWATFWIAEFAGNIKVYFKLNIKQTEGKFQIFFKYNQMTQYLLSQIECVMVSVVCLL